MERKEEEQIRGRHFHDLKNKIRSEEWAGWLFQRHTVMEPNHRGRALLGPFTQSF